MKESPIPEEEGWEGGCSDTILQCVTSERTFLR